MYLCPQREWRRPFAVGDWILPLTMGSLQSECVAALVSSDTNSHSCGCFESWWTSYYRQGYRCHWIIISIKPNCCNSYLWTMASTRQGIWAAIVVIGKLYCKLKFSGLPLCLPCPRMHTQDKGYHTQNVDLSWIIGSTWFWLNSEVWTMARTSRSSLTLFSSWEWTQLPRVFCWCFSETKHTHKWPQKFHRITSSHQQLLLDRRKASV